MLAEHLGHRGRKQLVRSGRAVDRDKVPAKCCRDRISKRPSFFDMEVVEVEKALAETIASTRTLGMSLKCTSRRFSRLRS